MRKLIVAILAACLISPAAGAQVKVNGYVKKDGTYVAPHYRSSPNSTTSDNYSTKGNTNPYTGKAGTRDPYANPYGYGSRPSSPSGSSTTVSSPYGSSSNEGSLYGYDPD